ncbi:hypothetical protein MSIM_50940 [Mycobacterium simiae]|nr:hypothetical protein MSIM_50940 [Mycobacterium simiae]
MHRRFGGWGLSLVLGAGGEERNCCGAAQTEQRQSPQGFSSRHQAVDVVSGDLVGEVALKRVHPVSIRAQAVVDTRPVSEFICRYDRRFYD